MGRVLGVLYGVIAYIIFFLTFLYSIAFVGNIYVAKSIDSGVEGAIATSVIVNLLLLSVWAAQHPAMARPAFKKVWTRVIPKSVERSTFVLLSSLALLLIYGYWQPMQTIVWDTEGTMIGTLLLGVFWAGWGIVLLSTFMINHFDLFGLRQVYVNFQKLQADGHLLLNAQFYKLVRHPIMSGFMIAFWATPTMTQGHLLFAVVTTVYMYLAVKHFEEKDLVDEIGEQYVAYQKEVGTFIPGIGKKK